MIHNKRHWEYKSFRTPQANKSVKSTYSALVYQDQEIFRTSWGISIFCSSTNLHKRQLWDTNVFPTATCSPKQTEKNGRKCGKRSTTNTANYCVTHAVCTLKIACNARSRNNFERIYASTDDHRFAKH